MSITTADARTAVRAANAAGKKATVVLDAGEERVGTARWTLPTEVDGCRTIVLFGVYPPGPYSDLGNGNISCASGMFTLADVASCVISLDDVHSIAITDPAPNSLLAPGQTDDADVLDYAAIGADYGTGLE